MMQIFLDLRELIRRQTKGKVLIQLPTRIDQVGLDKVDFIYLMIAMEILHHVEIPEELTKARTFFDLARGISDLPRDKDRYFGADRLIMLNQAVHQTFAGEDEGEAWKQAS